MFVKICGTTNLEDAQLSVELGADALGFIFAPSKRRVTVGQAGAIIRQLPERVLRVGVFTVCDVEEIASAVHSAGLTAVQMHWPYQAASVAGLRRALGEDVELWQVVGFPADPADREAAERSFAGEFGTAMQDPHLDVILLDTVKAGHSGGLGEAFSWERARPAVQAIRTKREQQQPGEAPHLLLAGGLRADNVKEAIEVLRPWGVDVVSGVEAGPGKKSPDRLAAFFAAVQQRR